jgi:hypothetical protein
LFHAGLQRIALRQALLRGVLADVLRNSHRTKMRTAHGTEVCSLGAFLGQRLVVELASGLGV